MARRKSELIETAMANVKMIRSRVAMENPEAPAEAVEAEVNRVVQTYNTLVLEDALDTLTETVRNWTP